MSVKLPTVEQWSLGSTIINVYTLQDQHNAEEIGFSPVVADPASDPQSELEGDLEAADDMPAKRSRKPKTTELE